MIGRKKELECLKQAYQDKDVHFIAVYGRRRVGKTYLIREAYNYHFAFQHAGLYKGSMKEQLYAFECSLKDSGYHVERPVKNWLQAFEELKELIRKSTEEKKVIFIDELSWMDTAKSDLMTALENFWNGWASARKDIVLIICTSATSWMISKVIHNKGGLYNRLTDQIHLESFCLHECEEYVKSLGIAMNREQILQYYMIFGGVPFYWGFLKKGYSLAQNVDAILFAQDAPLKDEFRYLYASIYKNPENYLKIIEALSKKKIGMTREELIASTGLKNAGGLTDKLEELESCGFIRKYNVFGKKAKGAVYQLVDFFTLFYYQFLENRPTDSHFWSNQINTPKVNTWMGLAFERVCLAHVNQVKCKLGISGVLTESHAWHCIKDLDAGTHGSQIDLLIVRNDRVINVCEMKYSNTEYTITDQTNREIQNKIHDFVLLTKTKYALYPTLITTYGLVDNSYSGNVQAVVTIDDLFIELNNFNNMPIL